MNDPNHCPKCSSVNIYFDGNLWICPECNYEWTETAIAQSTESTEVSDGLTRDAFGNILSSGDSITVIKELKIKGSSSVVKVGTKVKNIRITDSSDGHNIACKIDGLGAINLKSEFVKKA